MPSTPLRAIPYPTGGDDADVPGDLAAIATALDDAPRWARGSEAGAVSSGTRRIYEATDTGRLYYDTGTTLVELSETADVLAALEVLRAAAGLSTSGGDVRRGKSVIAPEGSRATNTYGALSNGPDQVVDVVLPTDGLLHMMFRADWKETVANAARAAIFLDGIQLRKVEYAATAVDEVALGVGASGLYTNLRTVAGVGLADPADANPGYAGHNVTTGLRHADFITVEAAAGTYTVDVRFKASSGTVYAKDRKLWVRAEAF